MALAIPQRHDHDVSSFVVPDKDWYEMELTSYDEPVPSAYLDKNTGEFPLRIRLVFAIREEVADDQVSFDGAEVSGWFDFETNKTGKKSIYHVLVALRGGEEVTEDDELELDDFLGQRCRGLIDHAIKPSKNDPTKMLTFANVVEVQPVKRRRKTKGGDPF